MTTADEILRAATGYINSFGWERMAYPMHGPAPRCIRAAIYAGAEQCDAVATTAHHDALTRVSEAIYGRGTKGGINDWEHRKRTTQEAVVTLLEQAIEMGPAPAHEHVGVWPV